MPCAMACKTCAGGRLVTGKRVERWHRPRLWPRFMQTCLTGYEPSNQPGRCRRSDSCSQQTFGLGPWAPINCCIQNSIEIRKPSAPLQRGVASLLSVGQEVQLAMRLRSELQWTLAEVDTCLNRHNCPFPLRTRQAGEARLQVRFQKDRHIK